MVRVLVWLLVGVVACGDPGDGSAGGGSGGGSSEGDGTTAPACSISDLHQCDATDLCGTIDVNRREDESGYTDAELCAFEALRDRTPGRLRYWDCSGDRCDGVDILMVADGSAYADFAMLFAESGQMSSGQPIPCTLPDASVFEACLAAFDPECRWPEFIDDLMHDAPLCECP
jgi:hypothetical protein